MNDPHEMSRLALTVAAGIGLLAAGLGNLLFAPRRWASQASVALGGVALAAGVATLLDSPHVGWIGLVGVGSLALLTVARVGLVRRLTATLSSPLRSVRARWAAVAVAGVGLMGYEATRFDQVQDAAISADLDQLLDAVEHCEGAPVSGLVYLTDRGTRLVPMTAATPRTAVQLAQKERATLNSLPSHDRLIHRGPPSDSVNCHGWVFTGGRHGLTGRDVVTILADNGYATVTEPRPGDVCIYRDEVGTVSHSAVVRGVLDDGTVLVEGKWGWLGVYLHPVQESCYGTAFSFHRSARGTHVLSAAADTTPTAALVP